MHSLGNDLAAIRRRHSLSIEDVQKSTRIPLNILESIEDNSIFTRLENATTYIRSYVRSYAKAVGIDEEDIVLALNQMEAGTYEGHLARPHPTFDDTVDEAPAETDPASTNENETKHEPLPEDAPKKQKAHRRPKNSSPADLSHIDWANVGHKAQPPQSKSRVWQIVLGIVLLGIVIAGLYLMYNYYSTNSGSAPDSRPDKTALQTTTPSDSLQEALQPEEKPVITQQTPSDNPDKALPDTLVLTVYAANGKLEPVRVYTDIAGKRNPYWISKGDAMRFAFVNTVRVRAVDQYNRLQLLFNGHVIEDFYNKFYNPETGMVELNRSVFEKNPQWLEPAK